MDVTSTIVPTPGWSYVSESDKILDSRTVDYDAAQRLTEIIDIVPDLPDGAGDGGERNGDLSMLGNFNIDLINDPVYQALVATGLFRPR